MSDTATTASEDFSRKMIDILNHGALNLAVGIGYRMELFDVMDAFETPETVENIARQAGLNSRYVKEWLGVMCTGGIVTLTIREDGSAVYFLPRSHGDVLARRSGNNNLGVYAQEIPILTLCAIDQVLQGFRTGEGVPYADYPKFQAFMTELANAKHRQVLIHRFLPTVDGGRLTARLEKGIRVCDLGCGEGVALNLMAAAYPESQFTGIDMDPEVIAVARDAAMTARLENVRFLNRDAATLGNGDEFENAFDYITAFDAIHDQREPLAALEGILRMLAPGGCFSMIDIDSRTAHHDNMDHPMGPFLYTVSLMHCMPVGLFNKGAGLGMMWGREQAADLLTRAGFDSIAIVEMPHDPFNVHYFCRK